MGVISFCFWCVLSHVLENWPDLLDFQLQLRHLQHKILNITMHIQIQSLFPSLTQTTQFLQLFQPNIKIGQTFSYISHSFTQPCLYIPYLCQTVCENYVVDVVGFLIYLGLVFVFLEVVGCGFVNFFEFFLWFLPVCAGWLF